jgi:hypothetical protein
MEKSMDKDQNTPEPELTLEELLGITETEASAQAPADDPVFTTTEPTRTKEPVHAQVESFSVLFKQLAPKSAARYEATKPSDLSNGHGVQGDPGTSVGASAMAPVLLATPAGELPFHSEIPKRKRGRPRKNPIPSPPVPVNEETETEETETEQRPNPMAGFYLGVPYPYLPVHEFEMLAGPYPTVEPLLQTDRQLPPNVLIYQIKNLGRPKPIYMHLNRRWIPYVPKPEPPLEIYPPGTRIEFVGSHKRTGVTRIKLGTLGTVERLYYRVTTDPGGPGVRHIFLEPKDIRSVTPERAQELKTVYQTTKAAPDRACPICGRPCVGAKGLGRHKNSAHPMKRTTFHPIPEKV